MIRTLRVTRASAVKARTQAFNTLFGVMIGAPSPLRDELVVLTKRTLVNRCLRLRPETEDLLTLTTDPDRLLTAGIKTVAARPGPPLEGTRRRDQDPQPADRSARRQPPRPQLVELHGVGVEIAGQFLVTAGDNPERIRNEAAFAKLCGVAPQPASSGRTTGRHRLSRSGDRAANSALYIVTIVRMRHHEPTRAYVERRTAEGLSKREIIRCLKRYIAREIYANLPRPDTSAPAGHRSVTSRLDEHRSIERFQQTLKKWLRAQPPAGTLTDLQTQLDAFLEVYNHQRPHRSLAEPHPRAGLHRAREGHPHRPGRALADPPRQGRQDRARHPAPRRTPAPHRPGLRTQQHHRADPRPRPTHHRHQRRHRRDHPRPDPRPHPRLPTPGPTTRTTQRQPPTRRTQEEHPTDINEVAGHLLTMSRDFTHGAASGI